MTSETDIRLKRGWTTGACATAATKAALYSLWSNEKLVAGYNQTVPLQRMAEPDEMAGVVMLLASEAGSYMTGGVYAADGGYLISG